MQTAIHFWVTGRVQGVYFRASTQAAARQLGLTGWVRNLPDGRVEGVACGPGKALDKLVAWLHHGPEHAAVTARPGSRHSPRSATIGSTRTALRAGR